MPSDEQVDRVVQAIETQTQVLAGALQGIEEAIRAKAPPPSSRPSQKTKVGK